MVGPGNIGLKELALVGTTISIDTARVSFGYGTDGVIVSWHNRRERLWKAEDAWMKLRRARRLTVRGTIIHRPLRPISQGSPPEEAGTRRTAEMSPHCSLCHPQIMTGSANDAVLTLDEGLDQSRPTVPLSFSWRWKPLA